MSSSPPSSNEIGFNGQINGHHNGVVGPAGEVASANHVESVASRGPSWKKRAFCELYGGDRSNSPPEGEAAAAAGGPKRRQSDNQKPDQYKDKAGKVSSAVASKRKGEDVAGSGDSSNVKRQAYDSGRGTDADEPTSQPLKKAAEAVNGRAF